jgi:ADP-heptose:LPS heptosyltransferase
VGRLALKRSQPPLGSPDGAGAVVERAAPSFLTHKKWVFQNLRHRAIRVVGNVLSRFEDGTFSLLRLNLSAESLLCQRKALACHIEEGAYDHISRAVRVFGVKRLFASLIRLLRRKPLTKAAKQRRRLIAKARRNLTASIVLPRVVELPTLSSGCPRMSGKPTILILSLAHIGDFVLSLRALEKIRRGFPGSHITLVSATWNAEWARKIGFFECVLSFDFFPKMNRNWNGADPEIYDRFATLSLSAYDIAVDLRHDPDTRPCLYRVHAKVRAGFEAPVEVGRPHLDLILPNIERLPLSNGMEYSLHAELRLELLADAVVNAYASREGDPVSLLSPAATTEKPSRPFAVLSLGAGDPIRCWSSNRFGEIARRLIGEHRLDIVLVGGLAEKKAVETVASKLPADRITAVVDLPLIDLPALIAKSSVLVGLGSGVTHLSATLGVPTVAILSGVSPLSVWRPIGPHVVALTGEMPCSPCMFREEKQCPFGVACLNAITSDHVMAAVDRLLREEER